MSSSLWIGTTGLTASEKQMDVIGNNLANANTVGFKADETYFASMLSQNISGGAQRVGQGVGVAAISTLFSQGSFQSTSNTTDLAIDGNGFFVVKDNENNILYTRAGEFDVKNTGLLADVSGYTVQGHMFDDDGIVESQTASDLDLQNVQSKPKASTTFSLGLTLDSQTAAGGTFDTSVTLYDSRGAERSMSTEFAHTEDVSYWSVQNFLDDEEAISQTYSGIRFNSEGHIDKIYSAAASAVTIGGGGTGTAVLTVNNEGQLYKSTTSPIVLTRGADANSWTITDNGGYANMTISTGTTGTDDQVTINLDGAGSTPDVTLALAAPWAAGNTISFGVTTTLAEPEDVSIRFYAAGSSLADGATIGTDGLGAITWNLVGEDANTIKSFATTSRISNLDADGYAPGIITSLAVDKNGIVEGVFSNGQRQKLARVLLADFPNNQGLDKIGSYFVETGSSGPAVINNPGSGGLGSLQSSSLEISNTDVAKEFIKMITAQRAYQASSKIITAADQMLQQLMNIKQ
jgi:flagellar hook protein FlgE